MRKKLALVAIPLALVLAGCGPTTAVGDKQGAASVKADVKGQDTPPDVFFNTPISVNEDTVKVLDKGKGGKINDGDRVKYRLAAYNGDNGERIQETYSSKQDSTLMFNDQLKKESQALYEGLKDQKEGATLAFIPKIEKGKKSGIMVITVTKVDARPEFKDLAPGKQTGDPKVTQDVGLKFGADNWAPELKIDPKLKADKESARIFGSGTGEEITEQSKLTVKSAVFDIASGKPQQETYSLDKSDKPKMADLKKEMPTLFEALKGQKSGVSAVYVPKAQKDKAATAMVLTVTEAEKYHEPTVLPQAGVSKLRSENKLPTIKEEGEKKLPSITIPEGKAPKDLVAETLQQGNGAVVKESDTVTVQYAGWAWDSQKNFDENFTKGQPLKTPLSNVIKGWGKGLAGQKVGSTVMLVIPQEWAYGEQPQGDAKGDLIFYVKIQKAEAKA